MPPIIEIRNLSKQYRLGTARHGETLREFLVRTLRRPWEKSAPREAVSREPFWALRNIDLDVPQGECLGIIGRNGAGKSTLLKIISRITDPSEGYVKLRGRFASLLEVGTGFHQELTGRENIFLNGAILGMHRSEILAKFDQIVAFSEVGEFLDTPVKRYSSGMYVRLAFSVASHLNPEILVVDEVLAVGDVAFQKKCLGRMNEVRQGGRTVLFVSHNMATVENLCQHAVVLDRGRLLFAGTAKEAVEYYLKRQSMNSYDRGAHIRDLRNAPGRVRGASTPLLDRLEFYTDEDEPATCLRIGDALKIRVHFRLQNPTESFNVGIAFANIYGQRIFTAHTAFAPDRIPEVRVGPQIFTCRIPSFTLMPGDYAVHVWLDINNWNADLIEEAGRITVVESDFYGTGKVPWNGLIVLKHRWDLEAGSQDANHSSPGDDAAQVQEPTASPLTS